MIGYFCRLLFRSPTLFALVCAGAVTVAGQTPPPRFETSVQPIFAANCTGCHGSKRQTKELNLSTKEGVLKGSESGAVIVPGKPDESRLFQLVKDGIMPKGGARLSDRDVATIRAWIESGAVAGPGVRFESDILPIFNASCNQCHGAKTSLKQLNLTTREGVLKGSESGPVVVPGKPDESRLYKLVHAGQMPQGLPHLSDSQVATIREWIVQGALAAAGSESAQTPVTQHQVIPVLLLRCAVCHGSRRQDGGLDLRTKAAMLRGGKSGPAILLGKPEESLLIRKIKSGEMPPAGMMLEVSVRPIAESETDLVAKWIAQGAPEVPAPPDVAGTPQDRLVTDSDRNFWAFQPPRTVTVPQVKTSTRVRNGIDAFVLQKLEAKGLTLSPEADRLTLIRRAYFDVTGMPPEPREVQEFLADPDPKAYEKLIDRLLASPRYGERWARYWLDTAGYADSEGKNNSDPIRPTTFRYRDYVIRSLNADKPYDRFLLEQIAGDELMNYEKAPFVTQEMLDNLIATGFLNLTADATNQRDMGFVDDRLDVIADEIDVLSSTTLGLTIKCARCHSHKYDPIPQRDYYRLAAIFKGAYDEHNWIPPLDHYLKTNSHGRQLPYVEPGVTPFQALEQAREHEAQNTEIQQKIDNLKEALQEKQKSLQKTLLDTRLREVPTEVREEVRGMLDTKAEKRTPAQKSLAIKYEKQLKITVQELKRTNPEFRKLAEDTQTQIAILESSRPPEATIRALWDHGNPSPTYILRRGSPSNFGDPVEPGVPAVLMDGKTRFTITPPWPGAEKTGRRLAFVRWLTQPDQPLTARVMVNRMWAHHFGEGIVSTVDNFGKAGARPTHPELLDWLAREFVRQGWSMKAMHRLMLTSATYRQASVLAPDRAKLDPDNKLLSRMPMKRMDAETLYDTLVLVSGHLDETRFGYPSPVLVHDDGSVAPIETEKGWRRAIYLLQRRKETPTFLANFDFPQMSPNCVRRSESTVATQALFMMNNSTVRRFAEFFAKRVAHEAGSDPERQVEQIYWIALSRPPSSEEKQLALNTLLELRKVSKAGTAGDAQFPALEELCHSILNTAAFVYID